MGWIEEDFHSLWYLTAFHISFKLLSKGLGAEQNLHICRVLHSPIHNTKRNRIQVEVSATNTINMNIIFPQNQKLFFHDLTLTYALVDRKTIHVYVATFLSIHSSVNTVENKVISKHLLILIHKLLHKKTWLKPSKLGDITA